MTFRRYGPAVLLITAAIVVIGGFGAFPATAAPRVVLAEEFTATW